MLFVQVHLRGDDHGGTGLKSELVCPLDGSTTWQQQHSKFQVGAGCWALLSTPSPHLPHRAWRWQQWYKAETLKTVMTSYYGRRSGRTCSYPREHSVKMGMAVAWKWFDSSCLVWLGGTCTGTTSGALLKYNLIVEHGHMPRSSLDGASSRTVIITGVHAFTFLAAHFSSVRCLEILVSGLLS